MINNRSGFSLDTDKIEQVVIEVLNDLAMYHGEVGVTFVSSGEIEALNKEYLGRDGVTDVISFPIDAEAGGIQKEDSAPRLLGDVVICPVVAEREASVHGTDLDNEICLLAIHGILHLAGFDHEVDDGEMDERQAEFNKKLCN